MIIGSAFDRPIGYKGRGIWHEDHHEDQPFVVLRRATKEEYMAQDDANFEPFDRQGRLIVNFYEISTD